MWKKKEYTYIGSAVSRNEIESNFDFIQNYQKSIFFSLVEKGLLTPEQCEQCIDELESQGKGQAQ